MNKILFVTNGYPGDVYTEKAFVEPGLKPLLKYFDEIILLPMDRAGTTRGYDRNLSKGVKVDWTLMRDKWVHSKPLKALRYGFHPFVLRSLLDMRGEAHSLKQWTKGFFQAINTVRISQVIKKVAQVHGMTSDNTLLMSMWFLDYTNGLARFALRHGFRLVTHAHTDDLFYDSRTLFRSMRLRARMLYSIEKVMSISKAGVEYLEKTFPEHSERFVFEPLGSVRNFSPVKKNNLKADASDKIEIFTVARFHPVKRHSLILRVLQSVAVLLPDKEIAWTLVGDGALFDDLQEMARQNEVPNLSVRFLGMLENQDIQKIYATTPPDWFLLMSSSEGLPVAIGEAMSYGIPIICTDVGETRELTGEESGLLLNANDSIEEYAVAIASVLKDPVRKEQMGRAALKRWESTFNADVLALQRAKKLRFRPQ